MDLVEIPRSGIARSDRINMANEMAVRYAQLREEVNNTRLPHEKELPMWSAASILDHLVNHTQDAEMQHHNTGAELFEMKSIAADACIEKSSKTGKPRINTRQLAAYEKLVKLTFQWAKQDPSKMWTYSGGSQLDPKTLRQGVISYNGKRIVACWEGARTNL